MARASARGGPPAPWYEATARWVLGDGLVPPALVLVEPTQGMVSESHVFVVGAVQALETAAGLTVVLLRLPQVVADGVLEAEGVELQGEGAFGEGVGPRRVAAQTQDPAETVQGIGHRPVLGEQVDETVLPQLQDLGPMALGPVHAAETQTDLGEGAEGARQDQAREAVRRHPLPLKGQHLDVQALRLGQVAPHGAAHGQAGESGQPALAGARGASLFQGGAEVGHGPVVELVLEGLLAAADPHLPGLQLRLAAAGEGPREQAGGDGQREKRGVAHGV